MPDIIFVGGASFAYQSGIPLELIKALGDWRLDTILIYLTMPVSIRLRSSDMLCKAILTLTATHNTISVPYPLFTTLGFGPLIY